LYAVIPVPSEGAELVTNGDFATDTDWTKGTGWTISGGTASCDGTQTSNSFLYQSVLSGITRAKTEITISNYTSGNLTVILGGGGSQDIFSANGTYTFNGTKGSDNTLYIKADSSFVGSVDNVSVKEYTSADMDVTRATAATRVDENGLVNYAEVIGDSALTGNNSNFDTGIGSWVGYNGGTLAHSTDKLEVTLLSSQSGARIDSNSLISGGQTGKTFKVRARIWQGTTTDTSIFVYMGAAQKTINISSTPTYFDLELTPTSTAYLIIYRGGSGVAGTYFIDDVTVKEVTRDNVPRIDYTGGGCPHILAEPQRTNLVAYSSDFSQWTHIGTPIISSDYGISPDGTQNADRVQMETGDRLTFNSSSANVSFSVYAKSNDGLSHTVSMRDGSSNVTYNMVTTNEWQRFDVYLNTTMTNVQFRSFEDDVDILMWAAQTEVGSYPTSYIPTSGSTVTRNQDIFTRDGIGSLINSTEGVLFVEMAALSNDGTNKRISLSNGSNSYRIVISYSTSNNIQIFIVGAPAGTFAPSKSIDITLNSKIAVSWSSTEARFYVDGSPVLVTSGDFSYTASTLSELKTEDGAGGNNFYGKVKQLQVYKTALTDEQLLQLTGESGTDFYESYAEMASALTYTIQ